ncbi:ATP-dependent nuclease [Anaerosporobacter sp.]
MRLYKMKIEGFRRHWCTDVVLSNATFLIGENNAGKSSILAAIDYFLTDKKVIAEDEFFQVCDSDYKNISSKKKIILTGEFRELPEEALRWKGFKGRVFPYQEDGTTKYRIFYRKTYEPSKQAVVELKEYKKEMKEEFWNCTTLQQYIDNGLEEQIVSEVFGDIDRTVKMNAALKAKLNEIEEIYDYDESNETWFQNPGGIPGNVLSKLPRVLIIPAQDKQDDLSGNSGALMSTLNELFCEIRNSSANFREAQRYLNLLANELDPNNTETDFGCMMVELNSILSDIFPSTGIHTTAKLNEADKVIKPQFTVNMASNVVTNVCMQGTGTIRAAVFALLRYKSLREQRMIQTGEYIRPLIIGFEEPELYLHPNAAYQMRETIYKLADSELNQIICTTHSPYMIDLGQKPKQVLNLLSLVKESVLIEENIEIDKVLCNPFNISEAFKQLHDDEKMYIKMLLKIDDYVAKVFFTKKVLIVEGDTEEVVIRETIEWLSNEQKLNIYHNWQIIKARGKAAIISLVKFLKAMGVEPLVMHDSDIGTQGAEVFNQPILEAVGDPTRVFQLNNCMEDILGYTAPSSEKPFKAYKYIKENWNQQSDIPEEWLNLFKSIFGL